MDLGDRMKLYEGKESDRRFVPLLPVLARLDGRAFHSFTKGMKRPYDSTFRALMVNVAHGLIEETNALVAYIQSDEISLVWYSPDPESQIWFDGRIQKMTSQLAAHASVIFNLLLPSFFPDKAKNRDAGNYPTFDARVWTTPTLEEAANCFLWRERDATRNSILSAGQAVFSHKQLHGKNTSTIQDMLHEAGINWNDYHPDFKRGTWLQKKRVVRPFTTDELDKLPERHHARMTPNLDVERWEIQRSNMPPFGTVTNRADVIFLGHSPDTYQKCLCDAGVTEES